MGELDGYAQRHRRHTRNLREWMFRAHAIETGKTLCGECGVELSLETMSIGHWPVPDYLGGTRTRNNVRPECFPCNNSEGGAMANLPAKLVWEIVYERATGFVYRDKMRKLGLRPIHVSPNFGKVYRKAKLQGRPWTGVPRNTPLRACVWRNPELKVS